MNPTKQKALSILISVSSKTVCVTVIERYECINIDEDSQIDALVVVVVVFFKYIIEIVESGTADKVKTSG